MAYARISNTSRIAAGIGFPRGHDKIYKEGRCFHLPIITKFQFYQKFSTLLMYFVQLS